MRLSKYFIIPAVAVSGVLVAYSLTVRGQGIPEFHVFEDQFEKLFHRAVLNGTAVDKKKDVALWSSIVSVHVNYANRESGRCTGFIISPKIIMTAGHCIQGNDPNTKVYVKFTTNSEYGRGVRAKAYRSSHQNRTVTIPKRFSNGSMPLNRSEQNNYVAETRARSALKVNATSQNRYFDIAVIKVDELPSGYRPIQFYKGGMLPLRYPLTTIGYGLNSRDEYEIDEKLRYAPMELLGYFNVDGKLNAFEAYGLNGSPNVPCGGDSGGPMLVKVGNEYQVLGVTIEVNNVCAGATTVVFPGFYQETIDRWIAELLSIREA